MDLANIRDTFSNNLHVDSSSKLYPCFIKTFI